MLHILLLIARLANASAVDAAEAIATKAEKLDLIDQGEWAYNGQTLNIALSQDFFDNFSTNFFPYLLQGLSGYSLPFEVVNSTTSLKDLVSWDANLTDFKVGQLDIEGSVPLVKIGNSTLTVQLTDFLGQLQFDYAYILDPPILADIGEATFTLDHFFLNFTFGSTFDENSPFQIQLSDIAIRFDSPDPLAFLDGLSDFSDVAGNVLNTIFAVIRNRGVYLTNQGKLTATINQIVNKILTLLPSQIPLGETGWYLDGGLFDNPIYNATGSMPKISIPLQTYLQSESYPYDTTCEVDMPDYSGDIPAQANVMISDCFLNAIFKGLNGADLLKIALNSNETTTNTTEMLIGSSFIDDSGYSYDSPCIYTLSTVDPAPTLAFGSIDSQFLASTHLQIQCKQTPDDEEYHQLSTLLIDLTIKTQLRIDENVTLFVDIDTLKVNLKGSIDDTVNVDLPGKAKITLVQKVVKSIINSKFKDGISINGLLQNSPLGFFNLTEMWLETYEGYATVFFTPQFSKHVDILINSVATRPFDFSESVEPDFLANLISGVLDDPSVLGNLEQAKTSILNKMNQQQQYYQ